ncbi:SHD1 domain-containing protein [Roseiconus sp. JC912]
MKSAIWISVVLLVTFTLGARESAAQEVRTWADSSGRFKLPATLIEVKDGTVFLKRTDGQTVKVPLDRLSPSDQQYLRGLENPFEMVAEDSKTTLQPSASRPSSTPPQTVSGSADNSNEATTGLAVWGNPPEVRWTGVKELDEGFGDQQWTYQPVENTLSFEPKPASVPEKKNFFEGMRRLQVNPVNGTCVAGYTWTFSTPEHVSRISLVDLKTGQSRNSELVTCNMCPLAVLQDGETVLMQGTGREREGYETGDQLQLWKFNGTKIARSGIWIPFPSEKKAFGKTVNAQVSQAFPIANNRIILLADNGHLACFDLGTLSPQWHFQLSQNRAITMTVDHQQMFVLNERRLLHVDPLTGDVKGSLTLEGEPRMGWTKIRLNPTGERMLISYVNHLRVIDLVDGKTLDEYATAGGAPLSPNGLGYPADDYALLNNHLLFHIPSRITLCDYKDAASIETVGGLAFVGILSDRGGRIVPLKLPHPEAETMLKQAVDDPSVFLMYPGVQVSLDVSDVPAAYRAEAESGLREAIGTAGYRFAKSANLQIKAAVTGPVQEAVSYIARGAYIANKYTTTVEIRFNGEKVWSRSSSNIPGVLMTKRGQSIQEKLDELGRSPNVGFFKSIPLPKLLQKPTSNGSGNQQNALMVSKFTMQGIVDSK